ncbi:carnosine N-methyltransferase [Selaginella moellendorffii]|uniref:carnosine N-methyltransferase n=1 Tax=Selaginella moellendorffii TaxID=88036 RepID=UPI000D1C79B7|nr:carnosine N-methyltransferase [Selaginella moellendorffii]|eukprot:XP_024524329.1 carnosine N-methyltransferase [Selaginella moellendorffii]
MERESVEPDKIDGALEMKALRRVIATYLNYASSAEDDVRRWERSYSRLPSRQKELLSHLPKKYAEVRRCISRNFHLISTMLRYFEPPFEMSDDEQQFEHVSDAGNEDVTTAGCKNHKKDHENANGWKDCRSETSVSNKRLAVENEGTKSAVEVQGSYEMDDFHFGSREMPNSTGGFHFEDNTDQHLHVRPSDVDKVRCVLRNIVRDWTKEGAGERDKCYSPLLQELQSWFPNIDPEARPSCLVPGAGLGRLALEISRLGFMCQGNEFSYYVLICSSFILNQTVEPDEFEMHPWIHSNCNKISDKDQLQSVRFPDVHPGSAGITEGFSMCAGDFLEVYGHESQTGAWDAVVTCFFIDTAHNVVDYIEVIHKVLKPGGVWINLGPLLYHFADAHEFSSHDEISIELSLEDVKKVAFSYGFELKKESTVQNTYTSCPTSMSQHLYYSSFWTMIKR